MQTILSPEKVNEAFRECLTDEGQGTEVDMIVAIAYLDSEKVSDWGEAIFAMLMELPEQFRESGGGGWSFLNACDDRHGNQWTGEHRTMAMLFALGQAAGFVECQLPREMWKVLPGGMPYYVIKDQLVRGVV